LQLYLSALFLAKEVICSKERMTSLMISLFNR